MKFITLDLETKIVDGIMYPYCSSIYDGKNTKSFYILDYINDNNLYSIEDQSKSLLKDTISYLLKSKYSGYKVYSHNFSYFDGIFLMKIFSELNLLIKPIIREDRFIETKIFFESKNIKEKIIQNNEFELEDDLNKNNLQTQNKNDFKLNPSNYKHSISFRDSYLLLQSSLDELGKTFCDSIKKDIFPYEFVNSEISLTEFDYKGKCPIYKYFYEDKVTEIDYLEYYKKFETKEWDLKQETITYCENDVKVLYEVIDKFSLFIFQNWNVDIMKTPTISSLAFRIYRTKFLQKDMQIPIIIGKIYEDIKKSYTGGHVDVYKPYGENINVYDVKSLYPSCMLNNPMPVGNPVYFEGNILEMWKYIFNIENDKPFGFFYCNIEAPEMYAPILQKKHKVNNLVKTICPTGTWSGWYFSEELYNSQKYGYKFTIEKGYLFDKGYIFNDYVMQLYKIKEENKKGSVLNWIAKLLLNSLYGRFGMKPDSEFHEIVSDELAEIMELDDNIEIEDINDFNNGKTLISYKKVINDLISQKHAFKNISVSVASSITAYGRIHMSQFKNDMLYYSDTDSIAIEGELDTKYIGKELGKMELEKKYYKVLYLSPKVYIGLKLDENNNETLSAKIKGVKNISKYKDVSKKIPDLTFDRVKKLLLKNSDQSTFKIPQVKWVRKLEKGHIQIKPDEYSLMVTGNKRELIYKNETYINTKPFDIHE